MICVVDDPKHLYSQQCCHCPRIQTHHLMILPSLFLTRFVSNLNQHAASMGITLPDDSNKRGRKAKQDAAPIPTFFKAPAVTPEDRAHRYPSSTCRSRLRPPLLVSRVALHNVRYVPPARSSCPVPPSDRPGQARLSPINQNQHGIERVDAVERRAAPNGTGPDTHIHADQPDRRCGLTHPRRRLESGFVFGFFVTNINGDKLRKAGVKNNSRLIMKAVAFNRLDRSVVVINFPPVRIDARLVPHTFFARQPPALQFNPNSGQMLLAILPLSSEPALPTLRLQGSGPDVELFSPLADLCSEQKRSNVGETRGAEEAGRDASQAGSGRLSKATQRLPTRYERTSIGRAEEDS
ncbi:hypothetical protein BLNAU_22477 [Blattamonas nauphoetae]|uniref:Uncharacterized protein n=1 Tax=Blattamonas nauphoetae TaxID=2049346 RepID=A0ABQ9WSX4_9EUKA|nr:hypothetical protein BLNAU_22477 [Blattamonas nauphoetae]